MQRIYQTTLRCLYHLLHKNLFFFGLFLFPFHQTDDACDQTREQTAKPVSTKNMCKQIKTEEVNTIGMGHISSGPNAAQVQQNLLLIATL